MTHSPPTFRFTVSEDVFERFPNYVVGCLIAIGIDNTRAVDAIEGLLDDAESQARDRFYAIDVKSIPEVAIWREAFSASGWTPSKFPSSVEALTKRVARGDALPRINPIVDLVNAAVLLSAVPIGAHDLDSLPTPELSVRLATPSDVFLPMGDAPDETPDENEIVYASGTSVRTRRWVWRQSRSALVGDATTQVFIPIDGFDSATGAQASNALKMLRNSFSEHLGASVTSGLVSAGQRDFEYVGDLRAG